MATLTADQIADFRADIGDTAESFSGDELNRLYTRAGGVYAQAVLYAIDQLIASSAKFADYTQNQSSEKKKQIFDNLLRLRELWKERLAEESPKTQARIVGMRSVPPRRKDRPHA